MIIDVLPRTYKLSRPAPVPGQRVFEQVIVSNVDLILPVFAVANPMPKWGLLDRYLVSAEAAAIPVLIVINKLDRRPPLVLDDPFVVSPRPAGSTRERLRPCRVLGEGEIGAGEPTTEGGPTFRAGYRAPTRSLSRGDIRRHTSERP